MLSALKFYWKTAQGYRLRPWKSPYLRWRLETYLGAEAANPSAGEFFRILWRYRAEMGRFLDWAEERRREQRKRG